MTDNLDIWGWTVCVCLTIESLLMLIATIASLHQAMRSIVDVSLFVARWYSAICAFRSSLTPVAAY